MSPTWVEQANAHGVLDEVTVRREPRKTDFLDEAQLLCALECFLGRPKRPESQGQPCVRCGGDHAAKRCTLVSAPAADVPWMALGNG